MEFDEFIREYNGNEECTIYSIRELRWIDYDVINWLAMQHTAKAQTWLGKIECIRCDDNSNCCCYHHFVKAIELDPEYIIAYRELILKTPEHMTVKGIIKVLNIPEYSKLHHLCFRELTKRKIDDPEDISALSKIYIKLLPTSCNTYEQASFINTFINQDCLSIPELLNLFPANAGNAQKKNLKVLYQLCDEIRRLYLLPGGPEYLEAMNRLRSGAYP